MVWGQIFLGCARTNGADSINSSSCGPSASSFTTTSGAIDGIKLHTSTTYGDGAVAFSLSTSASKIKIKSISLGLARVGSPSGTLTLTIEGDSAGSPNGTIEASGTRTFSSSTSNANYIGTTPDFFEITLSSTFEPDLGKTYWIHLERSGAASISDYLIWAGATALSQFTDVKQLNLNFSTWSTPAGTGDLMTKFSCRTSE